MLFQWTRLASNQFRLLERRKPLPSGEPSFVLQTFSLTSTSLPAYAAITHLKTPSNSSTESVVLNGRSFSVPKMASEALLQVQRHDAEGYEYLWVDWLCVNQKDENEKRFQESIVGRVFEGAKCVIGYLPGDTRAAKTFDHISTRSGSTLSLTDSERVELASFVQSFDELGQLPNGHQLWSSSEVFALADVVLYAGSDRFDRKDVERLLSLVDKDNQTSSNGKVGPANSCL
jgi:hypothetical protein